MTETVEGQKKREIVLVMGMHRSGTSAFTRVCNLLGGALPEPLIDPAIGNELGHWEPAEVVAMNDRALASAGSDVNSVFPFSPAWSSSEAGALFTAEVEAFVRGLGEGPQTWVIKDPRISVLADFWRAGVERAGSRPRFVIAFRNPWEVATSLASRQLHHFPDEVWPLERGLALWLRYVLTAERRSRGYPRSFVGYEGFLTDWAGEITRVYSQLGLTPPAVDASARSAIETFLQPDQRHARHEKLQTQAGLAMKVYDVLLRLCSDPEAGYARLDEAYKTYAGAVDVFGGYMQALESRAGAFAPLRALAEREREIAAEQKGAAESADRKLAQMSRQLIDLQAAAPEDADSARTLRRLKAKHEALKAAHRDNVEAYTAQAAAYTAELKALEDEHAVERRAVAERLERDARTACEELQFKVDALEANLAKTSADYASLLLKSGALEDDMAEARAGYEELRLEAARTRARLAELEHAHAAVTLDFQIARRELDVIHRSRSWRITAPLRSASKRVGAP